VKQQNARSSETRESGESIEHTMYDPHTQPLTRSTAGLPK